MIIFASLIAWGFFGYLWSTEAVPTDGGSYSEGLVGQPLYVNPLLSQTSEADSSLVELIYGSLFKYDKAGNLKESIAERYDVSEDGKEYIVYLRKNVKWHDGESLKADDVVFTINTLNDNAYNSPLRKNWQGVEIEKIDEYAIKFILKNPYFGFLSNLTMGILPEHIWGSVTSEKFSLVNYNLEPIGSGPYEFVKSQKDSNGSILSYELKSFGDFFEKKPYISKIIFNFYPNEDLLVNAYNKKEINGIGNISLEKIRDIKSEKTTNYHDINLPHYFSVFLNQTKSVALAYDEVREALNYGVNRQEIISQVLGGKGTALDSIFLSWLDEYNKDIEMPSFDLDKANRILDENGWERKDGGIREKDGVVLEFEMLTFDWAELSQTVEILSKQWEEIGIRAKTNVLTISDLQQNYIRPREYESILFGQATSFSPDPYALWHSSFVKDPGLNFSLFKNEEADKLMEEARQESNKEERVKKYQKLQEIIVAENPIIFLYSPIYVYPMNNQIKGLEVESINIASHRFSNVSDWYIKTKRVKK